MTRVLETLNALAGYDEHGCRPTCNFLPSNSWQAVQQSSADWQNKIAALRTAGDETNASAAETELVTIIQSTIAQLQTGAQRTMEKLATVAPPQPPADNGLGGDVPSNDNIPIDE